MPESKVVIRPGDTSCFKEAVCIDAERIYDSCSDKDCLEDLQVFFSDKTQPIIDKAASIKCKKVKGHIHRVKALVEGHALHVDADV